MRGNTIGRRVSKGIQRGYHGVGKLISGKKSRPRSRKGTLVYSKRVEEKGLKTQVAYKEALRKTHA